jgi:hypothetical protein
MLLAVVDPRLAPFWLAAFAGMWAIGHRNARVLDRWVWSLSLLAIINVGLFWVCIPYRTQQRFMLQTLGLAVAPLAHLLDRGRLLAVTASLLVALHLVTTQTWPFASREADIPWDLSPIIPNAVGPALPILSRVERTLRPSVGPGAALSLALLFIMAFLAGFIVWIMTRPSRDRHPIRRNALVALCSLSLVVVGAFDTGALGMDARQRFYPPFRDFYSGWLNLESRSGSMGSRVAYAGTNIPYYLFGAGLRNEVRYVNVDSHRDWLLHDYHRIATAEGKPNWPIPRPGWDRIHPDFEAWLANLESDGIQLLVVTHVNAAEGPHNVADTDGFPIEKVWADSHPELFEPIYGLQEHDPQFRIYRFHRPLSSSHARPLAPRQ